MSTGLLSDIITKFRWLTASGNSFQITNADIINFVNSFYLYDFPAQFRSLKLKDKYTFNTIQNVDTYPFDSEHYTTIQMPCYCMRREIKLFTDPWSFYGVNFNWQQQTNFATADGTSGPYSGILSSHPLLRSTWNNPIVKTPLAPTSNYFPGAPNIPSTPDFSNSSIPSRVQNLLITANTSTGTVNVTDDGAGNLIGDCISGAINYTTGAITNLTFTSSIPSGNRIQIQYNPFQASIPLSILFFQNQFTLRPVPDRGYTIELVAYRQPSQALLGTTDPTNPGNNGTAELNEWWETLAIGAAKKFYENRLDPDGIAMMDRMLKERYDVAYTRTYAQIGKQSIGTLFSDQLQYNYGSGPFGPGGI